MIQIRRAQGQTWRNRNVLEKPDRKDVLIGGGNTAKAIILREEIIQKLPRYSQRGNQIIPDANGAFVLFSELYAAFGMNAN